MSTAPDAVKRLLEADEAGELVEFCDRSGIVLLVMFGSAVNDPQTASDVDLALSFGPGRGDLLEVHGDLYRITGYEGFHILDLDRAGPVARERALVGCRLLFQAEPGLFARRQIAAIMERLDTDAMRRTELALLG